MIDRFLRRLSVRQRIVGGFVILLVLMALLAPLILATRTFIIDRLEQITQVEGRANRLLLLASARVESSRVNLLRYLQDYAPSAYESLDDADQAVRLLKEARSLTVSSEQQEAVDAVLVALEEYQDLIRQLEAARTAGQEQQVSRLLFQASRLGNNIGSRIEQIVADSETRVEVANQQFFALLQNRVLLLAVVYGVVLLLALILSFLIEHSITRPIVELTEWADAFRRGDLAATVPVVGRDELALLAQTFNEMSAQLQDLIANLEQRVAERTRDLETRAVQVATAAEVGRAAVSILDPRTLAHRVVDLVQERFGLYYVGLFLIDPEGKYAVLRAGSGLAGQTMEAQGHKLVVGGDSMVGQACALHRARIALDVEQVAAAAGPDVDLVRFDNPLLPDTRAELALPLIVGDRVLGALDVQATQPGAFSEDEIAVLQLVADQVAIAIQNAQHFAEVETMLETERRLYSEISRTAWSQLYRSRATWGYYSDEGGIVPLDGGQPPPLSEKVLRQAHTIIDRAEKPAVAIPIVVRDQVIGVIDACKPPDAGEWTERDLALLETLVGQLGAALDSARLYEDTQRRAARERLLSDVATRVRETLDVETVLRTAAQEIRRALGLPEVVVRLVEQPPESPPEGGRHA